jgi:hypothetical protein
VLFATIVMGRVGSGNPDNFKARLVNTYGSFYGIGPGPACPGNRGFVVGQQHFAAHRHRGCGLVRRVLYARLFRSALALRSADAEALTCPPAFSLYPPLQASGQWFGRALAGRASRVSTNMAFSLALNDISPLFHIRWT